MEGLRKSRCGSGRDDEDNRKETRGMLNGMGRQAGSEKWKFVRSKKQYQIFDVGVDVRVEGLG